MLYCLSDYTTLAVSMLGSYQVAMDGKHINAAMLKHIVVTDSLNIHN